MLLWPVFRGTKAPSVCLVVAFGGRFRGRNLISGCGKYSRLRGLNTDQDRDCWGLAVIAELLVLFCTTEDQGTKTLGLGMACTKGEQPKIADFGMAGVCRSGVSQEIVRTVVQG